MDPYTASAIRIMIAALVLIPAFFLKKNKDENLFPVFSIRRLILIVITVFVAYGVAVVAYVLANQFIDAGKTGLVTSTSPILLLILSNFILKENPGWDLD